MFIYVCNECTEPLSGLSGPMLCQCHRVTSTAPLVSSPAKNQLQACCHHLQDQLNQDSGLPV